MANEQTPATTNNQAGGHNPGLNELAVPSVQGAPSQAGTGDGVIDNSVDQAESDLVASFLDNYDEPSAEELLAEAGIESTPEAQPPTQQTPQLVTVQPVQPAQQTPQIPQQPGVPQAPAVVPQQVPGQALEVVQNQQIPGNVPQVPGQQQPQAAQPQVPVQGQPQAQGVAPEANPIEALRASVEAQRESFINVAAQSYASTFTDQDIEEFQADPRAAFSKMGARLHFDIVQNTLGMVASQLPRMVTQMIVADQTNRRSADEFFNAHPDLRAHEAAVNNIAQTYRQLNPQMPKEQFIQGLAALTRMQLNLAPPQQAAAPQPVQVPQPVRPQAFRPAGSQVPVQQGQNGQALENPWERIDFVMNAEDQGSFQSR